MNEFLVLLYSELSEPYLQVTELAPGYALTSLDRHFVSFPNRTKENQLIVSSGLILLDISGKTLINGMTLAEVQE
jgi:hypothetical protein